MHSRCCGSLKIRTGCLQLVCPAILDELDLRGPGGMGPVACNRFGTSNNGSNYPFCDLQTSHNRGFCGLPLLAFVGSALVFSPPPPPPPPNLRPGPFSVSLAVRLSCSKRHLARRGRCAAVRYAPEISREPWRANWRA